jgi:hypothetical protein
LFGFFLLGRSPFIMGRKRKDPPLADAPSASPLQARTLQVQLILNFGFKAENPCEFCRLNSEGCIMPPNSSNLVKCAACTRRGHPCVHRFHSESEYRSVLETYSSLTKEIQDLDQSIEASFAKRRRLEKQRDFLKERGTKLLLDDRRLEEDSSDPSPPPVSEDPLRISEHPSRSSDSALLSDVGTTLPLTSSSSEPFSLDSGIPPTSSDFVLVPDDLLFAFLEDSHIPESSQGS